MMLKLFLKFHKKLTWIEIFTVKIRHSELSDRDKSNYPTGSAFDVESYTLEL